MMTSHDGAQDSTADVTPDMTPDVTRKVLEERARVLARPANAEDDSQDGLVVLGFSVSGREHAIEISAIREILGRSDVSRLPWAPAAVAGVMNIRGEVVVVADAGRLLGVADTPPAAPVIVLASGPAVVALRVDSVGDVTTIPPSALVPLEGEAAVGAGAHLISGLTASTALVDPQALLSDLRLIFRPQEDK